MSDWDCPFDGPHDLMGEWHHAIPRATIKGQYTYWHGLTEAHRATRQLPETMRPLEDALADRRNLIPLCRAHHEAVTNRRLYVTRDMLPAGIEVFAAEIGVGWFLDRYFDHEDYAA